MKRGQIITIEGSGDKVGKHTQAVLLEEYLKSKGMKTMLLSFPTYGSVQASLFEQYLQGKVWLNPIEASIASAIDRSVTLRELNVHEFIESDGIVVCDRYTESNLIYQTARAIIDSSEDFILNGASELVERIKTMEESILLNPKSDFVIYLNMSEECNKKLQEKELGGGNFNGDVHEKNQKLLDTVRTVGISLARKYCWEVISCQDENHNLYSIQDIHEMIKQRVDEFFEYLNY